MSAFDSQPSLVGARVTLRPLRKDDFQELYAAASDPEIWAQHFEPSRCQRPVFRVFFNKAIAGSSALLVLDRATGRVIGTSRYDRFSAAKDEVEIGYTFLQKQFWGTEYNRDLKELMIGHAFRFVSNILFYVYEKNFRSQRAVEKLGAVKVEEFRGPQHLSFIYRLTREHWKSRGVV